MHPEHGPYQKKSILLPPRLWRQLEVAAAREQRTVSSLVRVLCTEAVGHIEIQEVNP